MYSAKAEDNRPSGSRSGYSEMASQKFFPTKRMPLKSVVIAVAMVIWGVVIVRTPDISASAPVLGPAGYGAALGWACIVISVLGG